MKHMKKRLIALLALSMLFTLAACGEEDPVTQPDEAPVDAVKAQRQEQKQKPKQEQEQETVFDFGAYAVEFKNAKLLEGDYGYDCLMLTLAYANIDPEETGRLSENIQCTAIQSGEELFPGGLHEYSENEPSYVTDGQIVDFHIGFHLQLEYNQVYYDMSEIEVVLQDKNSDLAYSFTVDPSVLDDSGLKTGGGKGTGETEGFGDFKSVLVPANFEFRLDSWKENNPHFVSIASRDWIYFNFRNYTYEEDLRNEYEYLKKNYTEGQIDVSANYGGIDWTGFQYDDGGGGGGSGKF